MSFPNRAEREKCWYARDDYWKCLDDNKITDPSRDGVCKKFRSAYEQSCSPQWVTHFDRKRSYLQFKQRIEKEGYEPLPSEKGKL